tara:strand:- start:214 stop:747 length:534 start_codon:yes stop_codon:yes gene_type:complete
MITLDCRDLAAHLRGQEASLFRKLLDDLPDFVYVKDIEGRFLYSNESHLLHLRLSEADLLGKNDFEIYPAQLAEVFFADETRLFGNQVPVVKVEKTQTRDGSAFLTVTVKQVICDLSGQQLGLIGTARQLGTHDTLAVAETRHRLVELLKHDVGPDVSADQLRALEASLDAVFAQTD